MSFLAGLQTNKAIATLLANQASTPEGKRALLKIKKIGAPAIPKLIEHISTTKNTLVIENLLTSFLNNITLPIYVEALGNEDSRVVESITIVLIKSKDYDCTKLLDEFTNPDVSKKALGEILLAHHDKLNATAILSLIDKVSSNVRPVLYRILDKIVSIESVDTLAIKAKSKEPLIRTHIATLLSRFDTPVSVHTLIDLLNDSNKSVRQSALKGLANLKAPDSVEPICQLLRDPDLMVQSTAIDCLVKIRDGSTVKYLIDVLQDESEYVRRAAVEVLNEVGDQRAIKDLLNALRDADWWVKVRAADALGSIGGPKVIDAVLVLIKDEDEFLRRTAVEILNTSNDPRAFDQLVEALKDEDWWVRERAADALSSLGNPKAVGPLVNMLNEHPEASQIVIKALIALGDARAVKPLIQHLKSDHNKSYKETLDALQKLTDENHAGDVQNALTAFINDQNPELSNAAQETMQTLVTKFGKKTISKPTKPKTTADTEPHVDDANTSMSLNFDFNEVKKLGIIDATKLKPGDVFADRYRVIRHVGKGAFGVVVLVEDKVVKDEFILKFLNPHFASDSDMIKRFTQELRYSRKVTHENIIRIYDLVSHKNSYAISMEYFSSHSLADELKGNKKIAFQRAFNILNEICKGMSAAEQVNVVHRDLKPSNILINEKDTVKIVDFGLAAAASCLDSRLTKTGILLGTPTYMAPEQIKGKTIDSKTDIYSLGVIMYEMFTGVAPYKGEGTLAVMYQHVEGNAKSPREVNPEIPVELEAIILKAMTIDPTQRFSSFSDLRAQLQAVAKEMQQCHA
ncbi:HEAT repeat domain-containing protein [Kaarinaea lacus]